MSNGSELKSPAAIALRAAGYKPLPRWWVTQEQLDLIAYMAQQNSEDVNRIRTAIQTPMPPSIKRKLAEMDAAWKMME